MANDPRLLLLSPLDNVFVLRDQVEAGERVLVEGQPILMPSRLGLGQKIARVSVNESVPIIKYGAPIGLTTSAIQIGDHVHLHNLKSQYTPTYALKNDDLPRVLL
jgi:SAF domain